jgi:hypothetical protein
MNEVGVDSIMNFKKMVEFMEQLDPLRVAVQQLAINHITNCA